jgi:hypothetical protein
VCRTLFQQCPSHKGGEDDDERLATLRTQLEKEILEGSCGALRGSGFTPNIAEVIMDEITLLIHLKVTMYLPYLVPRTVCRVALAMLTVLI